jgi:UDP-glucose 4-epimerase
MRAAGTKLLIFPSSGGTIYGDEAPSEGFSETMAAQPAGSYGLGKRLIEEILAFHARSGGPHCLILRIANAYGPSVRSHSRQGVINAFLERVRDGEPVRIWGEGRAVRDYVHVEDVLSALSALVQSGARDEIFNIGSGQGRSIREILSVIQEVTGRKVAIEHVDREYAGVQRSVLDISRIRERTGWTPSVGLPMGIEHLWKSLHF